MGRGGPEDFSEVTVTVQRASPGHWYTWDKIVDVLEAESWNGRGVGSVGDILRCSEINDVVTGLHVQPLEAVEQEGIDPSNGSGC